MHTAISTEGRRRNLDTLARRLLAQTALLGHSEERLVWGCFHENGNICALSGRILVSGVSLEMGPFRPFVVGLSSAGQLRWFFLFNPQPDWKAQTDCDLLLSILLSKLQPF
jgi:hypothetical protein